VHGVGVKWYRRLPYLAADPKSNTEAGERRRRLGLEAAVQTKVAAALTARVWGGSCRR
jgi:hypothetical protein